MTNPYKVYDIAEILKEEEYFGRGIIIGESQDGKNAVIAYFITGRSANSKNRFFLENDDGIIIKPYDISKMKNPELVVYTPLRKYRNKIIVTNGDQTDTICKFLNEGKTFEEALETRTFEPDNPNFTPRISGIVDFSVDHFTYKLSILKSMDEHGTCDSHYVYRYSPIAGMGHFMHTYSSNLNPLPPFYGEPSRINIPNDIDDFTSIIWNNLYEPNKISLYVKYIDIENQNATSRLMNVNKSV